MTVQVLPMGPRAALVAGIDDPAGWALALRERAPAGIVDIVPAAETVLVTCRDAAALAALRPWLASVVPAPSESTARRSIEVSVRYDGPDLAAVAAAVGLAEDVVVARHSGADYRAAFCGFSPGFAYLTGLPAELQLPRRASPRTRVPAGSVAIASQYSAVYPRPSPGGWHLLGTTDAALFDPRADPPALIQPGDRVRFVPC